MKAYVLGASEERVNIGAAIAEELYVQGWDVNATDCSVGDGTRPPGGNIPDEETARRFGYDPTEKGYYRRFDAPSYQEFLRIDADALVVSLGATYKSAFWEAKEWELLKVMNACLTLPLLAARRYVQAVEETERDKNPARRRLRHIVFIGSYAHDHPFTNGTAYCAAKAGIDMAARTLGWELTDQGYRVHCIHPWHVPGTPMWEEVEKGVMESKGWTKEQADAYASRDLKMPEHIKPEEVAEVVRVLLTEPSMGWLSGSSINLNGGTR